MKPARILWAMALLSPVRLHAQSFCEVVTPDTLVGPTLLGNGTPGSVTTAAIQAALNAGGPIRFNVGAAPTTITLTATLVINRAVVLDGAGWSPFPGATRGGYCRSRTR